MGLSGWYAFIRRGGQEIVSAVRRGGISDGQRRDQGAYVICIAGKLLK